MAAVFPALHTAEAAELLNVALGRYVQPASAPRYAVATVTPPGVMSGPGFFSFDWALAKRLGAFEIGLSGKAVRGVNDTGVSTPPGAPKLRTSGVGPAVNYTAKLGLQPVILAAKWEHAIGRSVGGEVIKLTVSMPFAP
jgi:hypothetical protein